MRAREFIFEKFDQSRADTALNAGMLKIAEWCRQNFPKHKDISDSDKARRTALWKQPIEKIRSRDLYNDLKGLVYSAIYKSYMRSSFDDEKPQYTTREWAQVISSFDHDYPELSVTAIDNPSGHLQMQNTREEARNKKLAKETKGKLYFTIDPKVTLDQVPKIMNNLIAYIGDDRNGTCQFKINHTNPVENETDTLCVYTEEGADNKKEYDNIKRIFPSVERGHRNDIGADHDYFPHRDLGFGGNDKESDSTVRMYRFAEFLANSYDYVMQLLSKYDDKQIASYFADIWKSKFAKADVVNNPVPPIKVPTSPEAPTKGPTSPEPRTSPSSNPTTGKNISLVDSSGISVIDAGVTTKVGKNTVVKTNDPDKKYISDTQFTITPNLKDGTWSISHASGATNATMVDGKELTSPVLLSNGMVVTIGNPKTGVKKFPLIVKIK